MTAPGQARIAGVEWLAIHPDGETQPIRIAVGAPTPDGKGAWGCRLWYEGPAGPIDRAILGEDAFQSLALALALPGRLLHAFAGDGGRVVYGEGEEAVPLESYFGPASAPEDPAT